MFVIIYENATIVSDWDTGDQIWVALLDDDVARSGRVGGRDLRVKIGGDFG